MAYRIVLNEKEVEAIEQKKKGTVHFKIRRKLDALLQLSKGVQHKVVAQGLGVAPYTLTRWCRQYKEEGLEKFASLQYPPKASVLDPHSKWLDAQIEQHNIQTIKQLNDKLRQEHQLSVHQSWLYRYCKKNSASLTRKRG